METIFKKIKLNNLKSNPETPYFKDLIPAFLDIETDGFSRNLNGVYLITIATLDNDFLNLYQFFANSKNDEQAIIKKAFDILSTSNFIVTYNGMSFDIPFLNFKAKKYNFGSTINKYNFDLFKFFKHLNIISPFTDCLKQKNIERIFNVQNRNDIISGKDAPKLFENFFDTNDHNAKKLLLLHNMEDVIGLYKLYEVALNSFHIDKILASIGFLSTNSNYSIKPIIKNNNLRLSGNFFNNVQLKNSHFFDEKNGNYVLTVSNKNNNYEYTSPLLRKFNSNFVNLYSLVNNEHNIGFKSLIENVDGYINNYMVLSENDNYFYKEINLYSMLILNSIMPY